ncbi:MAG TPA: GNAT family N-acetyltransferase, partial [Gammaproteobacteria bacterium]|nr:GNAT family N-acetyltransferase [Gammaproteobacteria bacterium]
FHESFLFNGNGAIIPQINLLYCGERAIAAQLCVSCGDTISLLKIAYDQSLARFSPGSVLLDLLLADCCKNQTFSQVSLITGQPWMDNWSPKKTPVADIWLFDRSSIATLTHLFLAVRSGLRAATQRLRGGGE